MKHCIMAAKGANTPHDAAELTLVTLDYYRRNGPTAGAPVVINHEGDARNIAHFLTEHLPAETLTALRNQFAEHASVNIDACTQEMDRPRSSGGDQYPRPQTPREVMKTFEVTGCGFDGATDETDDRVFWVKALSHDEVRAALAGTKAGFHEIIGSETDIDFHLPVQADLLKGKLLEFEQQGRKMSKYIESSSMTNDLGSSAHRYALASHDPDGVVRWSVGGEWSASLLDHSPTLMTGPEVDAFKVRHPNARIVDVIVYREACEVYSAGCNSVLDHSERSTPQTRQAAREAGIKALIRAGFPEDALNIVGPENHEQAPAARKLSNYTGQANVAEQGAPSKLHLALEKLVPHVLHYASMPHAHADAHRDAADARRVLADFAKETRELSNYTQRQEAIDALASMDAWDAARADSNTLFDQESNNVERPRG